MTILHITNGDAAAELLRAAGVEGLSQEGTGQVLPWRDVLHEGPVPPGLSLEELSEVRARWIAEQGWGEAAEVRAGFIERDRCLAASAEEVVLWFEHDLYDQLQLLQLLDAFSEMPGGTAGGRRLSLVQSWEYLGELSPSRIPALWEGRQPVEEAQLALGARAWAAFRAGPQQVLEVVEGDTSPLPCLAGALERLLEQLPAPDTGLDRTERQTLEALAEGVTPATAFAAVQRREERKFLGDTVFADLLLRLAAGVEPLVSTVGGGPLTGESGKSGDGFWRRPLELTAVGRQVLAGAADQVELNGIDRWLGGAHLRREDHWRWQPATRRLEHRAVSARG